MAKKKHKRPLDDYDFQDEPDVADIAPQPEVAAVSLRDFVIESKVQAFVAAYRPADEFTPGAVAFTDARLRETLKAYVCGLGDPLKLYIEDLKLAGFRMTMSIVTQEPTIFVTEKY